MRATAFFLVLGIVLAVPAAELESRVLTHYVPQDMLETAVRKEAWTEVPLKVKGGVRKGDVVRIWTGGSIDRGNGDGPGQNVAGPDGVPSDGTRQRLSAWSSGLRSWIVSTPGQSKRSGPSPPTSRLVPLLPLS